MAVVDPLFAQWLQSTADHVIRSDDGVAARWGATALTTERVTGIATRVAANDEADRQLAFFARGPFAIDVHQLLGTDWAAELGHVVTLSIDRLGYDAGVDCFVLEVEADRATGISAVTVLRPLRGV